MKKGMNSDEDKSFTVGDYRWTENITPTGVLDLEDIRMRSDLLKKRLEPILDHLVIANMKIERCINMGEEPGPTMYATRDKMYEIALEILKTEGKPV